MNFPLSTIATCLLLLLLFISLSIAQSKIEVQTRDCRPTDPTPGNLFNLVKQSGLTRVAGNRVGYGRLQIIDGCRFRATNFTLKPPGPGAYWAGVPKGQPEGVILPRIVPFALGSYNGQEADFTLQGASWSDMDGIGVYSEGDNAWYLIASWVQLKGDLENDESSATSLVSLPALTAFAALLAVWNAARHY